MDADLFTADRAGTNWYNINIIIYVQGIYCHVGIIILYVYILIVWELF